MHIMSLNINLAKVSLFLSRYLSLSPKNSWTDKMIVVHKEEPLDKAQMEKAVLKGTKRLITVVAVTTMKKTGGIMSSGPGEM